MQKMRRIAALFLGILLTLQGMNLDMLEVNAAPAEDYYQSLELTRFEGSGVQNKDGTLLIATGSTPTDKGHAHAGAYFKGDTADDSGGNLASTRVGGLEFHLPENVTEDEIRTATLTINVASVNANIGSGWTRAALFETDNPEEWVLTEGDNTASAIPAKNNDYSYDATIWSNEQIASSDLGDKTFDVTDAVINAVNDGKNKIVLRLQTVRAGYNVNGIAKDTKPVLILDTRPDTSVTVNFIDADTEEIVKTESVDTLITGDSYTYDPPESFSKDNILYLFDSENEHNEDTVFPLSDDPGDNEINLYYTTFTISEAPESVDVITRVGVYPPLPETVPVSISDGDQTLILPVIWDSVDLSEYAQIGEFTVNGIFEDGITTISAAVEVINKEDTLLAHYSFDDVEAYSDATGRLANASKLNTVNAVEGLSGKSFQIPGGNKSAGTLKLPDDLLQIGEVTQDDFTVSMFVKRESNDNSFAMILNATHVQQDWPGPTGHIGLINKNSQFAVEYRNDGSTQKVVEKDGVTKARDWVHIAIVTSGSTGEAWLYEDGQVVAYEDGITVKASDLPAQNNYLGRSSWGDNDYAATYDEFKVYNAVLTEEEIKDIGTLFKDNLETAKEALELDIQDPDAVTEDIELPAAVELTNGVVAAVSWESSDPSVIRDDGTVIRPNQEENVTVTLTANLTYKGYTEVKTFELTVTAVEIQSVIWPENIYYVIQGNQPVLPGKLTADTVDNQQIHVNVEWDMDNLIPGTNTVDGTAAGETGSVEVYVYECDEELNDTTASETVISLAGNYQGEIVTEYDLLLTSELSDGAVIYADSVPASNDIWGAGGAMLHFNPGDASADKHFMTRLGDGAGAASNYISSLPYTNDGSTVYRVRTEIDSSVSPGVYHIYITNPEGEVTEVTQESGNNFRMYNDGILRSYYTGRKGFTVSNHKISWKDGYATKTIKYYINGVEEDEVSTKEIPGTYTFTPQGTYQKDNTTYYLDDEQSGWKNDEDSASIGEEAVYEAYYVTIDRTALDEAIITAQAKVETDYTSTSWSNMQEKLAAALLVQSSETAKQAEVTAAASALEEAIAALVERADTTALDAAIERAESLTESEYTSTSWSTVKNALEAAKTVKENRDAPQTEVMAAASALEEAIAALVERADTTALDAAIERAEGLTESEYTSTSWSAVKNALETAKTVKSNTDASQSEVTDAASALETAMNALVKVYMVTFDPADGKDASKVTVENGDTVPKPEDPARSGYDFIGWFAAGAEEEYDFETPVTSDITLTARWQATGKDDLDEVIADIAEELKAYSQEDYTPESWDALQSALKDAQDTAADSTSTPERIREVKEALEAARKGLKKITCTVTFDPVNGSGVTVITVEKGSVIPASMIPAPVRSGYKLAAWIAANASISFDFNTPVTADITLKAVWEPKPGPLKKDIAGASVTVAKTVYNGKTQKPKVTVKYNGKTLVLNKDYTVAYKNTKNVGKATVIITGIGDYVRTKTVSFNIIPKANSIKKLTNKKGRKLAVKLTKSKGAKGYEISCSTKKSFKSAKKKSLTKTSHTFKKLKKNKIYYVRVRAYTKIDGKKVYSSYSKPKKIKITK